MVIDLIGLWWVQLLKIIFDPNAEGKVLAAIDGERVRGEGWSGEDRGVCV